MIPKVIHYCWFGHANKSDVIERCIASWRKYCPDYEIIEWNENNWDIDAYKYAKEAYEQNAWAFVSDVARLDVLLRYGGIYLDTDVEVLGENPFEKYLVFENVLCFQNIRAIATGLMYACEKKNEMTENMLKSYLNMHYSWKHNLTNVNMNRPIIQNMLPSLRWNGRTQVVNKTYIIGCEEYARILKHYGTRSWTDMPEYNIRNTSTWLKKIMRNPKLFERMEKTSFGRRLLPVYTFLAFDLQDLGFIYFIKLKIHKFKKAHMRRK